MLLRTLLRKATREKGEPLNIITFPTHERYESNLCKTGHNFYSLAIKDFTKGNWNEQYAEIPSNYHIIYSNPDNIEVPSYIDIDLVLSQNKYGQFWVGQDLARQIGCSLINIEHTTTTTANPLHQDALTESKKMIADYNVYISEYNRQAWEWENPYHVIHHGIDMDVFKCSTDILDREKVALSVVNDWANRDWCCGFTLWRTATGFPHNQVVPVKVIGDNPGISKPATDTKELASVYDNSRVYLNTSTASPIPTSMLEAMSCGCAIVSTNNCMIPEIIEHGVNGFLSNDPIALRQYTQELLSNDSLAKEMGEAARKTIEERFSLDKFLTNWNILFEEASNEG